VATHWAADIGYRFSRIEADDPLNAQGLTFGFGYRF
jgi:opacity protein-like surface antigen